MLTDSQRLKLACLFNLMSRIKKSLPSPSLHPPNLSLSNPPSPNSSSSSNSSSSASSNSPGGGAFSWRGGGGGKFRVLGCGTVFVTYTLNVSGSVEPGVNVRAQSVVRTRGGAAANVLAILAQLEDQRSNEGSSSAGAGAGAGDLEVSLVAPLGGGTEDARTLMRELNELGVKTGLCRVWDTLGVPGAWVIYSEATQTHTIINHNPIPEITHEEFIDLLGHILVPENYIDYSPNATLSIQHQLASIPPRASPPFDWIHFEGRSAKTTLSNIDALDSVARERGWRDKCVFSLDVGKKGKQGVEALIPHADVIFFSKAYALSQNYTNLRPFLLSLVHLAPPHAILIAHWGSTGSALLSIPTSEYFQSSGWEDDNLTPPPLLLHRPPPHHHHQHHQHQHHRGHMKEDSFVGSVRSGSGFYADGRDSSGSEGMNHITGFNRQEPGVDNHNSDSDDDDNKTEDGKGKGRGQQQGLVVDEGGAGEAFIAGMMYALSRSILPGKPYIPTNLPPPPPPPPNSSSSKPTPAASMPMPMPMMLGEARWRLEECLRFATELAGRKARSAVLKDLRKEMGRSGWFD